MKISNTYKAIIALIILSASLMSCMKNQDYTPIEIAGLSVIHASPTTEQLNVYADNNLTTAGEFSFGTKLDYVNAYAGSRTFTVTRKGSTTALNSARFTLDKEVGYSLFVIDKLESIKLLFLKDDLAKPTAGKAKIRFVNLSPDASALNLAIGGQTTDLFTNKIFKEYTTFDEITAADKVTFNVKNNATGEIEATLAGVKIEDGKIYTIYAKGLKANIDNTKFGLAIFTHK